MNKKHIAALVALAFTAALLVLLTGSLEGRKSLLAQTLSAAGSKTGSITQAENQALSAPRQLRAVWIATAWNIDWPSSQGLSAAKQQQEFIAMLDEAKNVGMNAVIVQVKPNADSLYPSEYGPWSDVLTGKQGQSPGYDPLAFMVEEAHKRNLEFHAWFNPYRIGKTKDTAKLAADHPALKHPDWVAVYAGTRYYNPGIPEVRDFVVAGITEVVKKYDIDAVHLDDYFYPYPEKGKDFPDDSAYQTYGKSEFSSKPNWRRDNVNRLVEAIHAAIKKEKPYVKFGISPFGVWRNQNADPTGSETTAGTTNYDTLFADTRAWINAGWVDYIAPQLYWNFGFKPAAYDKLADWWIKETEGKPVQLYIGHAPFKIGQQDPPGWQNPDELPDQLKFNARSAGKISGSILFSLKDIRRNPLGFRDRLNTELYASPALVPPMPWLGSAAPQPPKALTAEGTADGVRLDWRDGGGNPAYYAVYRAEGSGSEAPRLIGTVRRSGSGAQSFTDRAAPAGKPLRYVVTALDRLHNESTTSRTASADVPGRFAKAK
ncbi:glycoside hydrolase family 10 protein [Paenibacillus sp. GbtcB18]|uniref:glycoside hydrolase family 10 protein n=1 Tax=Paenibacillus sp. GbtcB18 TaxID=2824763 RepID=UPI001C2F8640|nr:family 10 glycosylhydrolase [Paenibacillus sp. GbtcB18]